MAEEDRQVQIYFVRAFIVVVCVFIVIRYFKRYLRQIHSKFHAWFLNRTIPIYNKRLAQRKETLFSELSNLAKGTKQRITILEIGAGGGANFMYYPDNSFVMCIDPNPYFSKYLERNMEQKPEVKFEFFQGWAEDLRNIPSDSVDGVVATLVLCSVRDPDAALMEVKRVLKPGGKLYYLEHVCADESTWTYKLQKFINPLHYRWGDGCSLLRKSWQNIDNAGFTHVEHEHFWLKSKLLFLIRSHLIGKATK